MPRQNRQEYGGQGGVDTDERGKLSDAEREFVRPLPCFRTGTAWRDVPERYGPWATPHTRFRRWAADGTFERMLKAAQAQA